MSTRSSTPTPTSTRMPGTTPPITSRTGFSEQLREVIGGVVPGIRVLVDVGCDPPVPAELLLLIVVGRDLVFLAQLPRQTARIRQDVPIVDTGMVEVRSVLKWRAEQVREAAFLRLVRP